MPHEIRGAELEALINLQHGAPNRRLPEVEHQAFGKPLESSSAGDEN
jgi:hypothetical protein